MKVEIEYRDELGRTVAAMRELAGRCTMVVAQKYLDQFPGLTAHVLTETTETVVHRATEWTKRNG